MNKGVQRQARPHAVLALALWGGSSRRFCCGGSWGGPSRAPLGVLGAILQSCVVWGGRSRVSGATVGVWGVPSRPRLRRGGGSSRRPLALSRLALAQRPWGGGPRAFAAVREELVERRSCLTTSCLMGGLTRRIMLERGGLQGQLSLEPLWLLSSNQRRGQEYLSGSSSSRESMSGNVKRRKNSSTSATTVQQWWR